MSKETKEDRIVRNIADQVTEHLHDLKSMEANPNCKELDVERWCQSFLRNCLGYTASTGYSIRAQENKGKSRPDLVVLQNEKPIFVVEVKKLGFDLNKSDFRSGKIQLNEYLNLIGNVKWGILTNGVEWKLFDFAQPQYNGIEVCSLDLHSEGDVIDFNKKSIEEKCYNIVDFHEHSYSTKYWDESLKEAMAFSPETLAKAILSADVLKYISKYVKGELEFKASNEMLSDKVFDLLKYGLNDAIKGWNEAKEVELVKYNKSQKRIMCKTKKAMPKKTVDSTVASASAPVVEQVNPVMAAEVSTTPTEEKKVG